MLEKDFLHQSDSRFCFSLDERHTLIRLALAKDIQPETVQVVFSDPMKFSRNHEYQNMVKKHEDRSYNYYEAIIEAFPMRLMYVFYLKENGKEYYLSESGLSKRYIFDLAFISAYQFVGENFNDYVKEKSGWEGRVIYQIFIERFNSRENPKNKPYVNMEWNNIDLRNNRNAFIGGDLYGVIDKLEYLKWLGVGAIYLTPIHPSESNHKYDVKDYFDVDEQFGGKKAFKELMEKAHSLDIKVMMDLVFNHMSYHHPIFLDVVENGRKSNYYDWFFIEGDKPHSHPLNYRCFGYFSHMPKLNTNNPVVQDYLISVGEYWVNNFKVDGFRLDVSEGVSHDFWNRFKIAIKDIKEDILIIGENWYNSESYLNNNQLDGVMNYPFLGVVSSYVLNQTDAKETMYNLEHVQMRYKDGHNRMMMNILASHDIQRFMNLTFFNKDLSLIGYSILVFYLGYPLIYYGEEIFMEGGNDPDNRRGMIWDSSLYQDPKVLLFRDLLLLRKEDALKIGDMEIGEERGLFYIRRTHKNNKYTLYTNMEDHSITFNGNIVISNNVKNNIIYPHGLVVVKDRY